MTDLYHLRSANAPQLYRVTKLNDDYIVESSYLVSLRECTCPAGDRKTCRHRQMLPFFLARNHINDGWMLDWATRQWRKPLCEDGRGMDIEPGVVEHLTKNLQPELSKPAGVQNDQWLDVELSMPYRPEPTIDERLDGAVPHSAGGSLLPALESAGALPAPSPADSPMKRRRIV